MTETHHLSEFFRWVNPFFWFAIVEAGVITMLAQRIYNSKPPAPMHWTRKLHLNVLQGAGAFTGWIAFGYLWVVDWKEPRWEYFIVAAVAFLGITGTLPWIVFFNTWLRQTGIREPQVGDGGRL